MDTKAIREEAQAELDAERAEKAKAKLKAKLRDIGVAEQVLENLRNELEVLERDIASE